MRTTTTAALALLALSAAAGEVTVLRHAAPSPPGDGALTLETWSDGAAVQVVGLDGRGRIVLARERMLSTAPAPGDAGAAGGRLPAGRLSFDTAREGLEHERCESLDCARRIAAAGEALVRAATMGPAAAPGAHAIMAKLCPSPGADSTHAHAPTAALAAMAATAPCKWRAVALEDLAPMPGVGRQTHVRIGDTPWRLRQARWAVRPDPR